MRLHNVEKQEHGEGSLRSPKQTCRCKRCEHRWMPKKASKPTVCPKCNSPYWDKERTRKAEAYDLASKWAKEYNVSREQAKIAVQYNVHPGVICPKCYGFLAIPAKAPDVKRCDCGHLDRLREKIQKGGKL